MKKRLSNEEYHALANSLSSSDFKALARSINDWNKERKGSKFMDLGTAFHDWILEDKNRTLELPKVNKTQKDTKKGVGGIIHLIEFYAKILRQSVLKGWDSYKMDELRDQAKKYEHELSKDYLILNDDLSTKLSAMIKSFENHPEASSYIYKKGDSWKVEESLMIEASKIFDGYEGDLIIKIRPDYITMDENGGYIVDLKSTRSSEYWDFRRDVFKFGYHSSAALYMKVANALGMNIKDFYLVATENAIPFNTEVYHFTDEMLAKGWEVILKGWGRYLEYKSGNGYTGYSLNGGVIEL